MINRTIVTWDYGLTLDSQKVVEFDPFMEKMAVPSVQETDWHLMIRTCKNVSLWRWYFHTSLQDQSFKKVAGNLFNG